MSAIYQGVDVRRERPLFVDVSAKIALVGSDDFIVLRAGAIPAHHAKITRSTVAINAFRMCDDLTSRVTADLLTLLLLIVPFAQL